VAGMSNSTEEGVSRQIIDCMSRSADSIDEDEIYACHFLSVHEYLMSSSVLM